MNSALVYIVVLNWNGYSDTLVCLNSLLAILYDNYRIIVCDNNSQDKSIDKLQEWSKERSIDLIIKYYDREPQPLFLEQQGKANSILLIQTGANLGFAGGNNIGIKYALADHQCEYIWILNNDTIVDVNALSALVEKCQRDRKIGICGSKLLFFSDPSLVQAWGGGTYNKWTGVAKELGRGVSIDRVVDEVLVDKTIDYVVGASMLVSVDFINDIGLMNEEYFLYHEEVDWSTRAIGKYSMAYAEQSIVYHKDGGSTGSTKTQATSLADYYSTRGILIYTKKYFPIAMPVIYLKLIYAIFQRLRRNQFDRIPWILALMLNQEYKFNAHK